MTKVVAINPRKIDPSLIKQAAELLLQGKTVVFPTETVYGLGANALDRKAVKKIFEAKGRPSDNPLIVHISSKKQLSGLVIRVPPKAKKLIDAFWPGPLTLIFIKKKNVPDIVTAQLAKIAIRMPSHAVARAILKKANVPVAAPSANLSGKVSPTHADDVIDDLEGRVDMIVDSGDTREGIESTVIDMTEKTPILLRPGTITQTQIEKVIGKIQIHGSLSSLKSVSTPASPGMKYRHYAPDKELVLVSSKAISDFIRNNTKKKIAVVTTATECVSGTFHVHLGTNKKMIARKLFRTLRELDKMDLDMIVVEAIDEKGVGFGIMNRLKKAASRIIT